MSPEIPEWTSMILISGLASTSLLRAMSLSSGVVPNSRLLVLITDELMPWVYGTSTTSPPHSFSISAVLVLTGLRELLTQSSPWTTYLGLYSLRLSSPHQSSWGTTLDTPLMLFMMTSLCSYVR